MCVQAYIFILNKPTNITAGTMPELTVEHTFCITTKGHHRGNTFPLLVSQQEQAGEQKHVMMIWLVSVRGALLHDFV